MATARNEALKGALDLLILKTRDRRGPLHGYVIATQIEQVSAEALRVEEGSLYLALHRLEAAGWISADRKPPRTSGAPVIVRSPKRGENASNRKNRRGAN